MALHKIFNKWHQISQYWLLPLITTAFIIGLSWASYFQGAVISPAIQLYSSIAILSLLLLSSFYHKQTSSSLVIVLFFFLGLAQLNTDHKLDLNLKESVAQDQKTILKGTVIGLVKLHQRDNNSSSSFLFEVTQFRNFKESYFKSCAKSIVKIRANFSINNFEAGQELLIKTRLKKHKPFQVSGVFNFKTTLENKGIYYSGYVQDKSHLILIDKLDQARKLITIDQIKAIPEQFRQRIAEFINQTLSDDRSGIYQALLIGVRSGISVAQLDLYKEHGIMHLLAISGLHMSLLAGMLLVILQKIFAYSTTLLLQARVRTLAIIVTIIALLFYGFIAGLNPPVFRALVSCCLIFGAFLFGAKHHALHIISATLLVILIIEPSALFLPSLHLSFGGVLGIILFYPTLAKMVDSAKFAPQFYNKLLLIIKLSILVSLGASLGVLPLLLYYFNYFAPLGIIINIIAEPLLCFWSLPLGLLAVVALPFSPELARLLLELGSQAIYCLELILNISQPLAQKVAFYSVKPYIWEILSYYILLIIFFCGACSKKYQIIVVILWCCLGLHFSYGLWSSLIPFKNSLDQSQISFLDMKHGSATLLELPNQEKILLDGGSHQFLTRQQSFVGKRVIAPFLASKRIWKLQQVIISHPHADHYNGLFEIIRRFEPHTLWINGEQGKYNYQKLITLAKSANIVIKVAKQGTIITETGSSKLQCIGPAPCIHNHNSNDKSLILRFEHHNFSALFSGDVLDKGEQCLLESKVALKSSLLVAPHHGSKSSGSQQFMAQVAPKIVVISSGKVSFREPLWRKQGLTILTTVQQGTLELTSNINKVTIKGWNGSFIEMDSSELID